MEKYIRCYATLINEQPSVQHTNQLSRYIRSVNPKNDKDAIKAVIKFYSLMATPTIRISNPMIDVFKQLPQPKETSKSIRQYLIEEIGTAPIQQQTNTPVQINKTNTIKEFLGIKNIKQLVSVFNPQAHYKKAYLTLDSKYAEFLSNNTRLRWQIADTLVESDITNRVNTQVPITNVISMRIYSVVIREFTSSFERGSILIEEFQSQSFIMPSGKRFHAIGLKNNLQYPVIETDARNASSSEYGWAPDPTTFDKTELLMGYRFNEGIYNFHKPISNFSTITMEIGNPLTPINIQKFQIHNCYFSYIDYSDADGGLLTIVSPEPHYYTGELYSLKIIGFTTSTPENDADWIELINNNEFTDVSVNSATTFNVKPKRIRPPGRHKIYIEISTTLDGGNDSPTGDWSTFTVQFDTHRTIVNMCLTYLGEQ